MAISDPLWCCTHLTGGANLVYPAPMTTVRFGLDTLIQHACQMFAARMNGVLVRQRQVRIPLAAVERHPGFVRRFFAAQPRETMGVARV